MQGGSDKQTIYSRVGMAEGHRRQPILLGLVTVRYFPWAERIRGGKSPYRRLSCEDPSVEGQPVQGDLFGMEPRDEMTLMLLFLSLTSSCLRDDKKPGTWKPFYVVHIGQPLGKRPDRE